MNPELHKLLRWLSRRPPPTAWRVAFSGGADSSVLLHLMAQLRDRLQVPLRAVHVDHGLQADSARWAAHCLEQCKALGVPIDVVRVDAGAARGQSPEAAARDARYRALAQLIEPGECVLTAHHRDDQAETLVLQLVRGSGPAGLAGMPGYSRLGEGWLGRPLMECSRARLRELARELGVNWIEDPSNGLTDARRNLLRHEVLPRLEPAWPGYAAALARAARHQADALDLLDELAAIDLRACQLPDADLSIAAMQGLSAARQRNLLRAWLRQRGLPAPSSAVMRRLCADLLQDGGVASPRVDWAGVRVRRYRDRLRAEGLPDRHDSALVLEWDGRSSLAIPSAGGVLYVSGACGRGVRAALFRPGALQLRFRRGGERLRPAGDGHTRALKKLFQQTGIPPWERARVPMLESGGRLVAVAGLWVEQEFAAAPGEAGMCLHWSRLAQFESFPGPA